MVLSLFFAGFCRYAYLNSSLAGRRGDCFLFLKLYEEDGKSRFDSPSQTFRPKDILIHLVMFSLKVVDRHIFVVGFSPLWIYLDIS